MSGSLQLRGRPSTHSPPDMTSVSADYSHPVNLQQYQGLHQQPPPPGSADLIDDNDGGYRYPGAGVGVLPSSGMPVNGMTISGRSNSLPVGNDFKSEYKQDFVVPQPPPPMQSPPYGGSNTASPQHAMSYNGGTDGSQPPVSISESSPPPQQTTGNAPYLRVARFVGPPPVPLACTECRSRHLKCDAGTPSCGRCVTDGRDCIYVKSRRGWKGSRRRAAQGGRTGSVSGGESGFGVINDATTPAAAGAAGVAVGGSAAPQG